jgi:hypothetical protein
MSEGVPDLQKKVDMAAGYIVASQKTLGISKAMELAGFSEEDRRNMTVYQKVRRRSQKLCIVEKGKKDTPPPETVKVDAERTSTAVSSLTTSSGGRNSRRSNSSSVGEEISPVSEQENVAPPTNNLSSPVVRRRLLESLSAPNSQERKETPIKKSRRTSKELQRHNALIAKAKRKDKQAMKLATKLIKENMDLPKNDPAKKSIAKIVAAVNKRFSSNISDRTASRYVRQGIIGQSPLKRGPTGDFPKPIYNALMGAYSTYLKLEQAESRKQSNLKQMAKLVNATVNAAGHSKTRTDLARKLQKDTADQFEVGKANVVEQRRVQWTTAYNLDAWFTTWKDLLIDLEFGRKKEPGDKVEGEVVFFDRQLHRIGNIDETDGSIDDTTGQRGGRPPMTFFAPDVAGGATAVNKSGYSSTIICGSNAAGQPFPPHFQLKSLAENAENQRLSIEWGANTKDMWAQFGRPHKRLFPCTFGMNEKAGMNAEELHKYLSNSILPLYPDIEDRPGKRVILKLDSGPGRMNVEMLASLRLKGLYIVPGVPNTTSQTQETDQSYGPFKSNFRGNIRMLSQARFDKGLTLKVVDLPLLVFGGTCSETKVVLDDAFGDSFSVARNLACWKKCGAVPLTRLPLKSKAVRREVAVGGAAAHMSAEEEADPEVKRLKRIEAMNSFYCDILSSNGYDGSQLKKEAPTRENYVAVTEAHSRERIDAIKKAKSAGQMFYATGGRHLNSDEFFRAQEEKQRDAKIAALEKKKKERKIYCDKQWEAIRIIKSKGELTADTVRKFTVDEIKTLLKWKKVKLSGANKKLDLVEAYVAAPKPPIQKIWSRSEEEELDNLRKVTIKDTALGVVASIQMAKAVKNNLSQLDSNTLSELKVAINSYQEVDAASSSSD